MENDKFPKAAFRWGCCRPEQTPPSPPPVGGEAQIRRQLFQPSS